MKILHLKFAGALVVCALSILGYTRMNSSEELDGLLLENIEALAAIEGDNGNKRGACIGKGSIVCPFIDAKVDHVYIFYSQP